MKNPFVCSSLLFLSLIIAMISGCGGGGGGAATTPPPTKALITVSSHVNGSDQIGSVNLTMELPAGVTVPCDATGLIPESNLFFSGVGSAFAAHATFAIIMGKFTAATPSAKATVSMVIATLDNSGGTASGMNPGAFATLVCDIVPGTTVDPTSFTSPSGVVIGNTSGNILSDSVAGAPPTATLGYSVSLQ